jgi:HK97 gp10 family phage protein
VLNLRTYGLADVKDGLKDLEKELVALGANEGRKVLTRAARNAFAPVLEAAKANVPVDTGLTRDNIIIATEKPKEGESVVNVGLRIKKAKEIRLSKHGMTKDGTYRMSTSPHWRWHFIEGGTSTTPARPFLRPALDSNADKVTASLNGELRKVIDGVLKKRKRAGVAGAFGRGLAEAKGFAKAGLKGFKRGLR